MTPPPGRPNGEDRATGAGDGSSVPPPPRPGATIFTIEGRAAPGLFVVAWLATIMGLALAFVGLQAAGGPALALLVAGLALLFVGLVAGAGSQALERRARGVTGYAGPSPLLVFAASIPLTLLLSVGVGFALDRLGVAADSPLAALLFLLATDGSYLGLLALVVVGTGSLSWSDMGVRGVDESTARAVLAGVALAIPVLLATLYLGAALTALLPTPESPLPVAPDPAGRLVDLVAGAIVAPVAEELFFRGFATTAWLRRIGARGAILRAAVFFAFAHVLTVGGASFDEAAGRALFAFLVRLPVALALGWVFVRFRSIAPSIALHAVYNALPLLIA